MTLPDNPPPPPPPPPPRPRTYAGKPPLAADARDVPRSAHKAWARAGPGGAVAAALTAWLTLHYGMEPVPAMLLGAVLGYVGAAIPAYLVPDKPLG